MRLRRMLADCDPDASQDELAAWLAGWAADGWVPEYGPEGVSTTVNGHPVLRFAMIETPERAAARSRPAARPEPQQP